MGPSGRRCVRGRLEERSRRVGDAEAPESSQRDGSALSSRLLILVRREHGVTTYHVMPGEEIDEVAALMDDGGEGVEVRAYLAIRWGGDR